MTNRAAVAIYFHGNDIDAIRPVGASEIFMRRPTHLLPLAESHRFFRRAESVAAAGFYLYENDLGAIHGNEVDFSGSGSDSPAQYPPAEFAEMMFSRALAEKSESGAVH